MKEKKIQTFKGLKPKPWQKVVHDAITNAGPKAGKTFVVKAKRQIGKTIIIEQELLRHAINYPNSVSICLSLTIINCRKIYKELIKGCIDSGIISRTNDALLEIEFITGSVVYFKSAEQKDRLRGYTIRNGGILCIDEAAYIQDDVFNIIAPWTDVNNANTLMVSTPRLKIGTFYDMYVIGMAKASPSVESFNLCDFDTTEMLSEEKLELYRKTMPATQFLTEYLGEFADDGGNVFNVNLINWKGFGPNGDKYSREGYNELYIGIDWGNGGNNDYTVISGFDENGEQRILCYTNATEPSLQINWIVKNITSKLDVKKIKGFLYEKNSIGEVYGDFLKKALPQIKIEEFVTTNESKREIIESLCSKIGNEEITLYKDDEQKRQFSAYEMEITKTGKITYNAPHGLHDDIVMASAIALHGMKKMKTKSSYQISYGSKRNINTNLRNKYE